MKKHQYQASIVHSLITTNEADTVLNDEHHMVSAGMGNRNNEHL